MDRTKQLVIRDELLRAFKEKERIDCICNGEYGVQVVEEDETPPKKREKPRLDYQDTTFGALLVFVCLMGIGVTAAFITHLAIQILKQVN